MKVFITAITSYLGSRLNSFLSARGHQVSGSTRTEIELGRPFDPHLLDESEIVVHCAHDFSPNAFKVNIEGAKYVCETARGWGVPRQIFISSYSANPAATSEYGRIKYTLESYFREQGEIIVRPGLVIGNGGLFGRNMRSILSTPVLPLVDRGRDPIAFIAIADFVQATAMIIESSAPGVYNLFHNDLVTLRTLTESLNRQAYHRALYLSVPAPCAAFLLSAAKAVGIRLPVSADNLKGLKRNRDCHYQSDLSAFVPHPCSLEPALRAALEDFQGDAAGPA